MLEFVAALIPSVGVGLLFWFAVRAMISADRRERAAVVELERMERMDRSEKSPDADSGIDGAPR